MSTKTCIKCNQIKELSTFGRNKANKDGLRGECKACSNCWHRERRKENSESIKAYDAMRRQRDALKIKDQRLQRKYGITLDQYNDMIKQQNGVCAICNKPGKLVVDHNHGTGRVRGLLHTSCNRAIGYLQDKHEIILSAASYVEKDGVF